MGDRLGEDQRDVGHEHLSHDRTRGRFIAEREDPFAVAIGDDAWFKDSFIPTVHSDGGYGIEKGLIYSFPIRSNGTQWEIIQNVAVNEFSRSKITATENELKEEKALVSDLLPK